MTLRITPDDGGVPSRTTLASATIGASQVTTAYNYLTIPFDSQPELTPGTAYWLVFDTPTTWGSYYSLGATDGTYASGFAQHGTWYSWGDGAWSNTSPAALDIYFDVYLGGETGEISGITVGSSGSGDAWAHTVQNATVQGTIYCQASSNTNKPCDTSRTSPVQQPFPLSEGNINAWKDEAAASSVTTGNLYYGGGDVVTLGAQKIEGDLTVTSGATLTVAGTLWVTGRVTVSGGGRIKLASSYGSESGVIVADGRVVASGGGQFMGNGAAGNYILLVTTSTCPAGSGCSGNPAVSVSGGTGAVILNAQQGTIEFSGGAQAKQATADTIIMGGGTRVIYETGIADLNFDSGPSGSLTVSEWNEI